MKYSKISDITEQSMLEFMLRITAVENIMIRLGLISEAELFEEIKEVRTALMAEIEKQAALLTPLAAEQQEAEAASATSDTGSSADSVFMPVINSKAVFGKN